ncbi:methyltransferase domain-containing protein [Pseudoduganella plicata]|uniref:Methyltransferase domain-containing protein n=1 Tax=Pseudoduganella plicata TaxID=321984 RepID=A0A4V1AUG5_9BURK|nr:methyltransferase domain-containing protein [Pseudoduganella plicata]QBQ39088.1 methyltransferase domain-containing protein [Pseudoduganella plicata]GGY87183.1 hypothetical protein GCM10007388_20620 [Pseudoduganella plicata]
MPTASEHRPLIRRHKGRLTLEFAPGEVQSEMDLRDPDRLVLAYARAMMCFVLFKPAPAHIVMVGLGGGSLAKFCHRYLPASRITVLELRADVIALRDSFAVPPDSERFRILHVDAATHMPCLAGSADVLLVDGFDVDGLPEALASVRFFRDCRRALRPDGVMATNLFSYDPRFHTMLRRLRTAFGGHVGQLRGIAGNNRILFAHRHTARVTPAGMLMRRLVAWGSPWPLLGFGWCNRLLAHQVVARLRYPQ